MEQWDLKVTDDREADGLTTFIIFCEDQNSEPQYFDSFAVDGKLKINTIKNQKQGKLNLDNTIAHCKDTGLIIFENDNYVVNPETNHNIWCVYDRDQENIDFALIRPAENIAFDTAIQTATTAGLNVAWSNDAFELWVLLHFETVPSIAFHRNYIYGRLTEIFRHLPNTSDEFQQIVNNPNFNYKTSFKKRAYFITHVLPLLRARTKDAIQRAIQLDAAFAANVQFHLRNPCTKVYKLVELLSK